jgi:WD40 repeat protein
LFSGAALAQQVAGPNYERDLKPLFKKHCTACHNARKMSDPDVSGGLALDSYEAIQAARTRKAGLFAGGDKSALLQRLLSNDDERRMPQGGEALTATEIALVRRWLEAGLVRGEPSAESAGATAVRKSGPSRQHPVLVTTGFQVPKGFMGGFIPQLQIRLPYGSMAPITALRYSPDGKLLAVGSYSLVVLWDLESVKPKLILADYPGAVHDLQFSPDSQELLVAGGRPAQEGLAWIYAISQGKWATTIKIGQDVITSASWNPKRPLLALGSNDKKIYLYDLQKDAIMQTFTGHSDGVTAVGFSPDGESILSASRDRSVKLSSAASGETKVTLVGTNEEELALAVHPDGKRAVSSGLEANLSWWDLNGGKRERRIRGHGAAINDVAFDQRGDLLVSASSDQTARIWNGKDGAPLRTLKANTILYSISILPDGSQVAAGGFDGATTIWDTRSGRQLLTLSGFRDGQGVVQWLAYVPEGFVSASAGAKASINWKMNKSYTQSHAWELLENPARIVQAMHASPEPSTSDKRRSRGKP